MTENCEELGAGECAGVGARGTALAEDAGTAVVLGRRHPLQVVSRPVEDVTIEVVAFIAFWARTEPCCRYEDVACSVGELAEKGIARVTMTVIDRRFESRFDLPQSEAREGEEVPATGTVERFAARELERTTSGGQHAALLGVDAHDSPAFVRETVRIHTDRLVNHSNTRFRGYERWGSGIILSVPSRSVRKRVQNYENLS